MNCSPPGSSVHGFSRQEYWSGFPCPPLGELPDPGIKPTSLMSSALEVDSSPAELPGKPLDSKGSICNSGRPRFNPWVRKIPWRRKWQPTPVFLPGKSMDRRAWQATAHEVSKNWTQLNDFHFKKIEDTHLWFSGGILLNSVFDWTTFTSLYFANQMNFGANPLS